ncbi:hypothetical protein GWI33_014993 [Rhynchophorus ferrugineus]|uniref:Uncharacterized protein n=1 Tax=Rhynchophorus ferrugineus TaxID=354439 RepID=A0A834MA67_RHYFE|nr:hypothetical protein GWI33_014993 [Rhynchophorus ferrugineus]
MNDRVLSDQTKLKNCYHNPCFFSFRHTPPHNFTHIAVKVETITKTRPVSPKTILEMTLEISEAATKGGGGTCIYKKERERALIKLTLNFTLKNQQKKRTQLNNGALRERWRSLQSTHPTQLFVSGLKKEFLTR